MKAQLEEIDAARLLASMGPCRADRCPDFVTRAFVRASKLTASPTLPAGQTGRSLSLEPSHHYITLFRGGYAPDPHGTLPGSLLFDCCLIED